MNKTANTWRLVPVDAAQHELHEVRAALGFLPQGYAAMAGLDRLADLLAASEPSTTPPAGSTKRSESITVTGDRASYGVSLSDRLARHRFPSAAKAISTVKAKKKLMKKRSESQRLVFSSRRSSISAQRCPIPHPVETINDLYDLFGICAERGQQLQIDWDERSTLEPYQQTAAQSNHAGNYAGQDGRLGFGQAREHSELLLSHRHGKLADTDSQRLPPLIIDGMTAPMSRGCEPASAPARTAPLRLNGSGIRWRDNTFIDKFDKQMGCSLYPAQFRLQVDAKRFCILSSLHISSTDICRPKQQSDACSASGRNSTKRLPPFGYRLGAHPLPKHKKNKRAPYSDGIPIESTTLEAQSSRKTPHQTCLVSADSGEDRTPFSPTSCGPHAHYEVPQ